MTDLVRISDDRVHVERGFAPEDEADAKQAEAAVAEILTKIKEEEHSLASNYARLGNVLYHIRQKKYWIMWGHQSWGSYIKSVEEKFNRGRTQLFQWVSIAENLLPMMTEEDLVEIGVSKAIEIKRVVIETGRRPSASLITQAKDPEVGVNEIRAAVFQEIHGAPPDKGVYLDLGGFYVSPDERAEILRAIDVAKRTDPVIQHDIPEPTQRKEVFLRFAREYLGTYEAVVEGGGL